MWLLWHSVLIELHHRLYGFALRGVYLFEPLSVLTEPFFGNSVIQTIRMCYPDDRHYKEFMKNGAVQYYMPSWIVDT